MVKIFASVAQSVMRQPWHARKLAIGGSSPRRGGRKGRFESQPAASAVLQRARSDGIISKESDTWTTRPKKQEPERMLGTKPLYQTTAAQAKVWAEHGVAEIVTAAPKDRPAGATSTNPLG